MSLPFALVLAAPIQGEGRLPVRRGWNETEVPTRPPCRVEEGPNRGSAEIPLAPGRHTMNRVLLKQGNESVEIGVLPGADVPLKQRALPIVRFGANAGPTSGEPSLERCAGALESAIHGCNRGIEQPSALPYAIVEMWRDHCERADYSWRRCV